MKNKDTLIVLKILMVLEVILNLMWTSALNDTF